MNITIDAAQLVEFARMLEHVKGKHVKFALAELERSGKLDPQTRKIILDAFNNMARNVLRNVGYVVEA